MLLRNRKKIIKQIPIKLFFICFIFIISQIFFGINIVNAQHTPTTLVGTPTVYNSAGSASAVVNKPTGVAEYDIMFAHILHYNTKADQLNSIPQGWIEIGRNRASPSNRALYYKVASSTEPASYTFGLAASSKLAVTISAYRGNFDINNPIDQISNTAYTVSNTIYRAAAMTLTYSSTTVLMFPSVYNTKTQSFTAPLTQDGGWTEDYDHGNTSPDYWRASYRKEIFATGTTGVIDSAGAPGTTVKHAFAVALKPPPIILPGNPIFYDNDGVSQITFNNIRQATNTPTFRISATSSIDYNTIQLELNTASDFSGTSYTQTFSGVYASGTEYNIFADSLSPSLPEIDNATYFVRARASVNAGVHYGDWSLGTQTFTYRISGNPQWFQTVDEQFLMGTLINTITNETGGVILGDSLIATGGTVSTSSGYKYHIFNNNGTFSVSSGRLSPDILVVAGGGGGGAGGSSAGGGGGAGGLIYTNTYEISVGSYTVTIGSGGIKGIRTGVQHGGKGGDSVFDTLTAIGGGGGRYSGSGTLEEASGGSGGGGAGWSVNNIPGTSSIDQGNDGGTGYSTNIASEAGAGGGGGAGGVGTNGSLGVGGNGAFGLDFSSIFGSLVGASGWFAGGGGGAGNVTAGVGRSGGGDGSTSHGTAALSNTGSGGGGGTASNDGGDGGSGIVMIRYPENIMTGSITSPIIDFDIFSGVPSWNYASWSNVLNDGTVSVQVYYATSSMCDVLISDTDLPGNSTGFTSNPIDISSLSTSTYNRICLKATLNREAGGSSPILTDWTVSAWQGIPSTPILYNNDGGINQIAFNDSRENDTTPIIRTSAVSPGGFNRFLLEFNTSSDFSGTSYTETFSSSTFDSGVPYNLETTSSLALPSTDDITYYVRVAASADEGVTYGPWSSTVWNYTYTSNIDGLAWYQTTGPQFLNGSTLSDTQVGTSSVYLGNDTTIPSVDNFTKNAIYSSYTVDLGKPNNVQPGDLLLIILANGNSSNVASWDNDTYKPSGFTFIERAESSSAAASAGAFYRIADGTEPSTTTAISAVSIHQLGAYILVKNASTTNPLHMIGATTSIGAATTLDIPSLTTIIDKTLAFFSIGFDGGDQGEHTVTGTGWTKGDEMTIGGSTGNSGAWGTKSMESAGPTGIMTIGNTAAASDGYVGFQFAIAPILASTSSGNIISPRVSISSFKDAASWGQAVWNTDETYGSTSVQVYYAPENVCNTIIPDEDLPGNSSGFASSSSPLDLSGLNISTYGNICLRVNLYRGGIRSPILNSWSLNAVVAAGEHVKQERYRWRSDSGSEEGASFIADSNTAVSSGVYIGDRVRLRIQVSNTGGITLSDYQYRLEYASNENSCSVWSAVPSYSASSPWLMDWSQYVYDNQSTTDSASLTNPSGKTFVPGIIKTSDTGISPVSLTTSQFTELEYSIRSTSNIIPNTIYCFRLTNIGATSTFTYSVTPRISVERNTSIIMYGGGSIESINISDTPTTGGETDGGEDLEESTTTEPTSTTTPNPGGGGDDVGLFNRDYYLATIFLIDDIIKNILIFIKSASYQVLSLLRQ